MNVKSISILWEALREYFTSTSTLSAWGDKWTKVENGIIGGSYTIGLVPLYCGE